MVTILQLAGLGDRDEVLLVSTDGSGQKRFLEVDKVSPLLEPLDRTRFRHRKLLYGGLTNRTDINITPDIVYNSISDPDRCSKVLDRVQEAAQSNPFPFINHPDQIPNVRPDRFYALTKEIEGIIVPQCIRITPHSLAEVKAALERHQMSAPLMFTEAGTDPERKNSYLLQSTDDMHLLERFAFDGRAYYVTRFYDYRSKDGLYRKYRFFVIGNKIMPGHLIISSEWNITDDVHAHKTIKEELSAIKKEEKSFLKNYQGKNIPSLLRVKEAVELDFFALDCAMDEHGTPILFGIDCEAHYFERLKNEGYYNDKQIQRYNEAVETMILNKLKEGGPRKHV